MIALRQAELLFTGVDRKEKGRDSECGHTSTLNHIGWLVVKIKKQRGEHAHAKTDQGIQKVSQQQYCSVVTRPWRPGSEEEEEEKTNSTRPRQVRERRRSGSRWLLLLTSKQLRLGAKCRRFGFPAWWGGGAIEEPPASTGVFSTRAPDWPLSETNGSVDSQLFSRVSSVYGTEEEEAGVATPGESPPRAGGQG